MIITVLIPHNLHPEVAEYVEKVKTHGKKAVIGNFVWLDCTDPDEIAEDIRRIGKELERIQNLEEEVKHPWIMREILDGKAHLVHGRLVYKNYRIPDSPLKREIEKHVGDFITDYEFKTALDIATNDIRINRIRLDQTTTLEEAIKIAAQSVSALKRCGK